MIGARVHRSAPLCPSLVFDVLICVPIGLVSLCCQICDLVLGNRRTKLELKLKVANASPSRGFSSTQYTIV